MRFGSTPKKSASLTLVVAWLMVALPLLIFAALGEDILDRESFRFDNPTLLWLHAHSNSYLDGAMLWFSQVGGGALIGVAALWCLFLWATKRRHRALFVLLSMGGATALNLSAKLIFARTRPDLWLSLTPQNDYSFPSGHAMLSSAFVLTALIVLWQGRSDIHTKRVLSALGVLFVFAVGVSRLYLGVHFPSDILAGWMVSLAWVSLLRIFAKNSGNSQIEIA